MGIEGGLQDRKKEEERRREKGEEKEKKMDRKRRGGEKGMCPEFYLPPPGNPSNDVG